LNWYSKLLLGWIIATLFLTWTPGQVLPKPEFFDISFVDLLVHFGIFTVFSFLLTGMLFYETKWKFSTRKIIVFVIFTSLMFSLITESGQILIPGRYFHILDIIMNFLGSLIGLGLFFLKFKYFSK
jgi:VanZ family protein